jgi:thiamine biosynthesis lipoprotein
MQTVTLARHAMATRFEIVLHGDDLVALRAAGEEALAEIDRLESQLSLYRPGSEISQVNARAAREPVQVSPELFALLRHARQLHEETDGAFDITVAPLVRCWGFMGANGRKPAPEAVARAQAQVGMRRVALNESDHTIRFETDEMMLDLGAIGKGYAVGRAAELLREAGVTSALLHGGTSTAYAIGQPPEADFWTVAIERPPAAFPAGPELPKVSLKDEALSVSAAWGRFFECEGRTFGHVLDPRNGQPVTDSLLSAVVLPCATETDALSTALLVLGRAGHDAVARLRPRLRTLLLTDARGLPLVESRDWKELKEQGGA